VSTRPSVFGRSEPQAADAPAPRRGQRELLVKRERLVERLTAMQLDLGGAYYEMAVRDHIRHDVLIRKAAEMQRVDAELHQVEQALDAGSTSVAACPACGALAAPGTAYCGQCGGSLAAGLSRPSSP